MLRKYDAWLAGYYGMQNCGDDALLLRRNIHHLQQSRLQHGQGAGVAGGDKRREEVGQQVAPLDALTEIDAEEAGHAAALPVARSICSRPMRILSMLLTWSSPKTCAASLFIGSRA